LGFRKVKSETRKIIQDWFRDHFSPFIWKEFSKGWVFVETEGRGTSVKILRVNRRIYDFISQMEKRFKHINAGVHVGNVQDSEFKITIGGAKTLGKLDTAYKIELTEKGEKRFLYGRDLHMQDLAVEELDPDLLGKTLVICNGKGNILGLGQYQPKPRSRQLQYSRVIKHVVDMGWFLRSGI
jgi:ribosome biogenesis protein Nip4